MNDIEIDIFLLRENEKTNDLLKKTTVVDNLLVESLWQYKI